MNRKKLISGLSLVLVVAAIAGFVVSRSKSNAAHEAPRDKMAHEKVAEASGPTRPAQPTPGLFQQVESAWSHMQDKVAEISRALDENERLRIENAKLKIDLAAEDFSCREQVAVVQSDNYRAALSKATGTSTGRALSSIEYQPPTHLLPSQLYTLGVTYFTAKENEKAAAIWTFLTDLRENDEYKTAKNLLLAGVTWYRLDNMVEADRFFEKVLNTEITPTSLPYHAQARLWRGLVAKRLGHAGEAQAHLRELIAHHPHSLEAGWVNSPSRIGHKPASENEHEKSQEADHEKSEE